MITHRLHRIAIVLVAFLFVLVASALSLSSAAAGSIPTTTSVQAAAQGNSQFPLRVMVPNPKLGSINVMQRFSRITSSFNKASTQPSISSFNPSQMPGNNGIFKTLAIMVEFSDNPAVVGTTAFDTLLFGTSGKTMRSFYLENSFNQLDVVTVNLPSELGWQMAPQTYAYYVNGDNCFGGYPQNCQKLTEDLISLVDPFVDFSQYDNDNNGVVDTVFVIHAGQGAEASGNLNQIWSHSWQVVNSPYVDGKWIQNYTAEPEFFFTPGDITRGVYAHELGHAMGLPDLYDIDYTSRGIGRWSMMSGGSWNGTLGDDPAGFDAWSRIFLGFTYSTDVTTFKGLLSIPAVEQFSTGTIFRMNTAYPYEYYLLENRQPIGTDAFLPGNGLLIWHVDDNMGGSNSTECLQNFLWLCGGNHFRVALMQSDGLRDLENDFNSGDVNDPYPGTLNKRLFTFSSTPKAASYFSTANTNIHVSSISNSATIMSAKIGNPGVTPPATTLINPSGTIFVGTPTFKWNAVNNVTSYLLWVTGPNGTVLQQWYRADSACAIAPCQAVMPWTLENNTYSWWVQTYSPTAGYGPWSASKTFTIALSPPAIPVTVSPSGTVTTSLPTFTWNVAVRAVSYTLKIVDPADPTHWYFFYVNGFNCTATVCTYVPDYPIYNGSYTWTVQAWGSGGFSASSTAKNLIVNEAVPAAPVPQGPTGTQTNPMPTFTWNPAARALRYELQISGTQGVVAYAYLYPSSTSPSGYYNCTLTLCSTTPGWWPGADLTNGAYTWKIRGAGAGGVGPWSATRNFTVVAPPPGHPILMAISGTITTTNPQFMWRRGANTWGEYLYIEGPTGSLYYNWDFTRYCDALLVCTTWSPVTLTDGETYTWWVQGYGPGGYGPWSAPLTFTVDLPGPAPKPNTGQPVPTFVPNQ